MMRGLALALAMWAFACPAAARTVAPTATGLVTGLGFAQQVQTRKLIRGKRGGCYYINRNGNKTYVDRSLCRGK